MKRLSTIAWLICRALDHRRDLARAQQRHGRDHHPAGLEHAEPGGEHRVAIGPAHDARGIQRYAVASKLMDNWYNLGLKANDD